MKIQIPYPQAKITYRECCKRREDLKSKIAIWKLRKIFLRFLFLSFLLIVIVNFLTENYWTASGALLVVIFTLFLFPRLKLEQLIIYKEELYLVEKHIKEQETRFLEEFLQKKNFDDKFVEEIRTKFVLEFA